MRWKLPLAALLVTAVPIAVSGQVSTTTNSNQRNESDCRVCVVENKTGSRLGARTRCGTKQEMANVREEQRRTVERIQSNRVSYDQ